MVIYTIPASNCTPQTIVIGRRGTYDTMQIAFDLSFLIENYGSGTAVLAIKRSQDESAYPAVVTQEDVTLLWTVNETDTAYVGSGECQLMWYVDGGLAKTIIYPMVVMRDILQTAEEPPDGYENWAEHLVDLGVETQQNAQKAKQSASEAEQAKDDAVDAKEASEEAARKAAAASVHAPIIQNGFWYIWSDDKYVNTNVRAEGEKGDKGDTGEKGDTGNGIASITKTGTSGLVDTYTVTYTNGTSTTFTVTNGAKGDKGDTGATGNGIASIEKTGTSGNVDTYTITYTNGQTVTFTVTNGAVSSVAGKTGAVVLDSGDIGYDYTETYTSGTVGNELSDLNRQISDEMSALSGITGNSMITYSDPSLRQYINTSGSTVSWDNPSVSSSTNIKWAVVPCQEGDVFTVTGKGGNSDRLWAFADASKNILDPRAASGVTETNLILTAPANAAYLVLNNETNTNSFVGKWILLTVDKLETQFPVEQERLEKLDNGVFAHIMQWERGSINTANGGNQNNNYRIRSNKIYFDEYAYIRFKAPAGYDGYAFAYDASGTLLGKDGWYNNFAVTKTRYQGASYLRFVIQVHDSTTTVVPISVGYNTDIISKSLIPTNLIKNLTCYIGHPGSDTNLGTKESPFASIQYAVDAGYKNICLLPGSYVQTLTAENIDGLNIYADNTEDYTSYTKKSPVVFTNGTSFTNFSTDQNGYRYFALANAPSTYTAVFINHTQEPIISGSYPSYRASLWTNHANKFDDVRVKPVLTYEELAEDNTFYYDGTNVYFNVTDANITGVTVGGASSYIFDFNNCNDLHINGINLRYADNMCLRVTKSNNVRIENCTFGYTMRSNCVTANYSNVIFSNCESFKATIDGFNSHYYGVSVFNDCRGVYNYDDGESSHEYCEIIVHGGEYHHNSKGGHAPVNGCKFHCDGTYTHDNGYGFYMVGSESFETDDILISNSVAKNNTTYDLQNTIYNTKLWNNIIGAQHVSSGTVTDLAT